MVGCDSSAYESRARVQTQKILSAVTGQTTAATHVSKIPGTPPLHWPPLRPPGPPKGTITPGGQFKGGVVVVWKGFVIFE